MHGHYPYCLDDNGEGGWIASFRDVPEALTEGNSLDDVTANAADALETALLGRMKDSADLPAASSLQPGERRAVLPVQTAAKLALYMAFRQAGISKAALARRLNKDEAEVRRMLDPYHATKLPSLEQALNALGHRLTLVVEPAN